MVKKEM